jgi:hypothetical protein
MAVVEPGSGDVPVIEDDTYDLTCIDVEEVTQADKYAGGAMRKKLKVYVKVHGTDDGEGNEIVLDPLVNLKWSSGGDYPASTLYLIAVALCGPQDGEVPFDTDNLKGKRGRGVIMTDAPGTWPKIKTWLAVKKGGTPGRSLPGAKAEVPESEALPLLKPDGAVDFTVFWAECAKRGITEKMLIGQLETAQLDELYKMHPLTVLNLLASLTPVASPF